MTARRGQIPPGPEEEYSTTQELLDWLGHQFKQFGDIYKASIYGTSVYVISDPQYTQHVLVENWQNYVKGQAIKRVDLHLDNGLMVSDQDEVRRCVQIYEKDHAAGSRTKAERTRNVHRHSWHAYGDARPAQRQSDAGSPTDQRAQDRHCSRTRNHSQRLERDLVFDFP